MANFSLFLRVIAVQVVALGFDQEDLAAVCHGDDVGVGVGGAVDHEAPLGDVAVPPFDIGQRRQCPDHLAFVGIYRLLLLAAIPPYYTIAGKKKISRRTNAPGQCRGRRIKEHPRSTKSTAVYPPRSRKNRCNHARP